MKLKRFWISAIATALCVLGLSSSLTLANQRGVEIGGTHLIARLNGFREVPPKMVDATGTFTATLTQSSISYKPTYPALTSQTLAAHLHFGQVGVNGGVYAFLCEGGSKPD